MSQQHPPQLILASTSVYRRRLLERLQIPFICREPGVDETPARDETPEGIAGRLGTAKALAVASREPAAVVLGSDQVASLGSTLLGKPGSSAQACEQLALCSGQRVTFYTAVALARGGRVLSRACVPTVVHFRALTDAMIENYVAREQPLDCAGSFRWEALGICLFTALHSDDPTALEGLPLIATCTLLEEAGFTLL